MCIELSKILLSYFLDPSAQTLRCLHVTALGLCWSWPPHVCVRARSDIKSWGLVRQFTVSEMSTKSALGEELASVNRCGVGVEASEGRQAQADTARQSSSC